MTFVRLTLFVPMFLAIATTASAAAPNDLSVNIDGVGAISAPLQLVLVGTTLELACFLFEIPTGIVADLYSRRLSVVIGVAPPLGRLPG